MQYRDVKLGYINVGIVNLKQILLLSQCIVLVANPYLKELNDTDKHP